MAPLFCGDSFGCPFYHDLTSGIAPFGPEVDHVVGAGDDIGVVLDLMIHDLELILHLVRSPLKDLHAVGVASEFQQADQQFLAFERLE